MRKPFLLVVLMIWVSSAVRAQGADGFKVPLIDSSLSAWQVTGCSAEVRDGTLVIGGQGRLRSVHPYANFKLRLQWRSDDKRCPVALQYHQPSGGENEAAVAGRSLRLEAAEGGQWNTLQLIVRNGRHRLRINDQNVHDLAFAPDQAGFVELVVEGREGATCEFRKMTIRELGHRSLFNGQDLSGWEGGGADASLCWKVEDGLLLCTGQKGPWLRTLKQYGDFNLRLQYRLQQGGNSGVYVRVPEDGGHHGDGNGVEVQILDDSAARYRTLQPYQFSGSIYKIAPATEHVSHDVGQWNALEIDCRDRHYRVIHNGVTIVDADGASLPELARRAVHGYLGLQNHSEEVYFRQLRIAKWPKEAETTETTEKN